MKEVYDIIELINSIVREPAIVIPLVITGIFLTFRFKAKDGAMATGEITISSMGLRHPSRKAYSFLWCPSEIFSQVPCNKQVSQPYYLRLKWEFRDMLRSMTVNSFWSKFRIDRHYWNALILIFIAQMIIIERKSISITIPFHLPAKLSFGISV